MQLQMVRLCLRYSLPIDNQKIRDIQASMEDISTQLRGKRWSGVSRDVSQASRRLSEPEKLLADIPEEKKPQAQALISQMNEELNAIRAAVEAKG